MDRQRLTKLLEIVMYTKGVLEAYNPEKFRHEITGLHKAYNIIMEEFEQPPQAEDKDG